MKTPEVPFLPTLPLPPGVFAHRKEEIRKKAGDTLTSGTSSQTLAQQLETRTQALILGIRIDKHENDEKEVADIKKELEIPGLSGRQTHKLRMRLISAEDDRRISNKMIGEFAEPHEDTKFPFFSVYTLARYIYRYIDLLGR